MPEGMAGVVVAVGAEGFADERCVRGVDGGAAEGAPVFAGAAVAAGSAAIVSGSVDGTE